MQQRMLTMILSALCAAHHAAAQAGADKKLGEVVVTATRIETEADSVAASITSLTRDAMARRVINDEADLFRDEPDVAFARDLRRFGATRPNIRGLEDNRVRSSWMGCACPIITTAVAPPTSP